MSSIHTIHTRRLVTAALFVALATILSFFSITVTSTLEIRFNSLAIAAAGILLGPWYGAAVGALSDIMGYMVHPSGAFFPGFTLSYALIGLIFGLIAHKQASVSRVLIAQAVVTVGIDMLLNTFWLSLMYGNAFVVLFGARLIKNVVLYPLYAFLLCVVAGPVRQRSAQFLTKLN
ncbi:folate family ECF transporter S component [Pseudoramibacter sp.]|jgi:ECF transporter S component (folate family)|uniref:folate family ECF transporter S component n=1 Tax=Pseudoramibacter sp. TaxID=2034862 RepID=UPI0025D9F017|nr:folate family ECF transporter S component [Pseudoramibacter sp.]MCH4071693.1 folate family ECF transporter S component [Pseudoramibacter sp.]MCH4105461.1 folate family ECF transporter S component [Pseudoramibacter sp.]